MVGVKKTRGFSQQFSGKSPSNPALSKFLKFFWVFFGLIVVFLFLLFALISNGFIGYMPPIEELENPKNKLATEVISSDGVTLSTYYFGKSSNRVPVTYEQLSPKLIDALIATEDVRFKNHSGIDVKALFRAVFKRLFFFDDGAGGGSTITQQLAKQLYTPQAETKIQRFFQKPIEWVIAVQLERFYTKEEIIAMYFNQYDFLYNAIGIKTAAQAYFNTSPENLDLNQSAILVGMCKNSSYYNPVRHPERALERRNTVLDQMRKAGYITKEVCDKAKKENLNLHFRRVDHKEGLAPYFREYLRQILVKQKPKRGNYSDLQKYSDDSLAWETNPLYGWCYKNKKADGSTYNIYTDGLKIYTTIDSRMQKYAEESVQEHIAYMQKMFHAEKSGRSYAPYSKNLSSDQIRSILRNSMRQSERYNVMKSAGYSMAEIEAAFNTKTEMTVYTPTGMKDTIMTPFDSIRYHKFFLRSGFMAMDPHNGAVRAYVGGVSFVPFQYDMITTGRRQVGSTIKPYLYALAMEEGYSPCDPVKNVPVTIMTESGPWTPGNESSSRVGEMVTLKWGLANSNNWISAYVMSHFSPFSFVRMLRSFGLNGKLDPVPSLCVGVCDASVGEMVSAYTSFANRGIRVQPLMVTRIEDKDGNILAHFSPQMTEVFSEETSYKMLSMLREVVNAGTGLRLRGPRYNFKAQIGGKTGTTQNNSDGWFMGITPHLVGGVWVGGEDRDIHFDYTKEGQGANMALPIWAIFMKKVYADPKCGISESDAFYVPFGMEFNCNGGTSETKTGQSGSGVFESL